jgi:TPR repeat protein
MVSADDAENDPRVDREACRALGIGSILAVPVTAGDRIVGLLEVFSPRPRAFTQEHERLLHQLVDLIPGSDFVPTDHREAAKESAAVQRASAELESAPKHHHGARLSRNLYLVVIAVVAIGATLAGYLSAPAIQRRLQAADSRIPAVSAAAPQAASSRSTIVTSPEELRHLADAGDAESQYWIGIHYSTGADVLQNDTEAAKWFQRAADQGHVQAQARLASWYWSGRGVPKDLSKAYFWARLAWAGGDENSKAVVEGLSSQMTRSQALAAQQHANDWLRQHNQNQLSH